MGYEITLLIGRDTKQVCEDHTYFRITATHDLGKCPRSNLLLLPWKNHTPSIEQWEYYAAGGDGNTSFTEDRYGRKSRPMPMADVIAALEKDVRRDNYRPAVWALLLLNKMQEDAMSAESFSVMLCAH